MKQSLFWPSHLEGHIWKLPKKVTFFSQVTRTLMRSYVCMTDSNHNDIKCDLLPLLVFPVYFSLRCLCVSLSAEGFLIELLFTLSSLQQTPSQTGWLCLCCRSWRTLTSAAEWGRWPSSVTSSTPPVRKEHTPNYRSFNLLWIFGWRIWKRETEVNS